MATKPATAPQPGSQPQQADGLKSAVSDEKVKIPRFPADVESDQPRRGKKSTLTPEQAAVKQRERRERFIKYAAKRVNGTLRRLKQVKALANKAGYEYTEQEAGKIAEVLARSVNDVLNAFKGQKEKTNEFSL